MRIEYFVNSPPLLRKFLILITPLPGISKYWVTGMKIVINADCILVAQNHRKPEEEA